MYSALWILSKHFFIFPPRLYTLCLQCIKTRNFSGHLNDELCLYTDIYLSGVTWFTSRMWLFFFDRWGGLKDGQWAVAPTCRGYQRGSQGGLTVGVGTWMSLWSIPIIQHQKMTLTLETWWVMWHDQLCGSNATFQVNRELQTQPS